MPRRRVVQRREVLPDPKFSNQEVAKFINVIMLSGKKAVAEQIVYRAFDSIQTKTGKDPLEVFSSAIGNVKPMVEVKSRRVGGANYQVPWKFVLPVVWHWLCAGCARQPRSAAKNPWTCVWPANCSKPAKVAVVP